MVWKGGPERKPLAPLLRQDCGNCMFFLASERVTGTGSCRRFPPVVSPVSDGEFPAVNHEEWCGEWKGKS